MRRPALIALFACLSCIACSDTVGFIPLELDEGDLLVLARVGPTGEVLELSLVTDPKATVFLDSAAEDTVHAFALDREALLRFDGREIDPAELAALRVVHRPPSDGADSCLSCPIPADAAPLLLGPGYSCPLPPFSRHQRRGLDLPTETSGGEDAERLRRSLRLEWPGACPCARERLATRRGPTPRCLSEAEPGPKRWAKLAVGDDGRLIALHPTELLSATASGAVSRFPFSRPMFAPAQVVAGLREGAPPFAVGLFLGERPDTDSEQKVLELAPSGPSEVAIGTPPGLFWQTALRDLGRQEVYFLGGGADAADWAVLRCDERLRGCSLETLEACGPGQETRGRGLGAGALGPTGDLLAPRQDGHLQVRRAGDLRWRCLEGERPNLKSGGPSLFLTAVQRALVVGERLYYCGVANSNPDVFLVDRHYVATARLDREGSTWHEGPVEIYAGASEYAVCSGLWRDPLTDRVHAFFANPTPFVMSFDAEGRRLTDDDAPSFPGVDERVALVSPSDDGRTLAVMGESGALYLARDGGPPLPLGPRRPRRPAHAVSLGEHALVLGGDLEPRRWTGACAEDALTPAAPLDERLEATTALPEGEVLGVGADVVVRYSPERGVLDRWSVALPAPKEVAHLAGSEILILDARGRAHVFSVETGALRPLPVYEAPGQLSTESPTYRFLAARDGVAWLSGGAELTRVRYYADGPRGERWWASVMESPLMAEDTLVGAFGPVALPCAGQGVVFIRRTRPQVQEPDFYVPRLHALEPSAALASYDTPALSGLSRPLRASSFAGLPLRLSASPSPIAIFEDGLFLRPDTEPWFLDHPDVTSVIEVGSSFVVGTRAGGHEFYRSP